ncbi:unnamed protein product [Ascophyllum nodosum]
MRFGGALSPWLIASFYGLLSVCLADDCVVSSDADYDYEVSASDDFIIYWTVDSDSEEITFKAIYSGNAWVGVGFSADGKMIGSDAVIGLPDDKTVFEYDLADKIVEAVTKSTIQNISAEDIVQEGGETTLVFTRPLSPTDPSKISLSSEEGEEAIFIWGAGKDNTLAEHAHKGSVTVTDIYCSGLAAATKDECSSSDPEFDFEVAPSLGLTLFWSVVESDTAVSVKAVYEGEGWLGIGFSDSGSMIGSDAVVGLPDENTVLEYDMDAHDTPSESPEQASSGYTYMQFQVYC